MLKLHGWKEALFIIILCSCFCYISSCTCGTLNVLLRARGFVVSVDAFYRSAQSCVVAINATRRDISVSLSGGQTSTTTTTTITILLGACYHLVQTMNQTSCTDSVTPISHDLCWRASTAWAETTPYITPFRFPRICTAIVSFIFGAEGNLPLQRR